MKKRSSLPPKTSSENSPSDVTALVPSLDRNVEAIKKILGAADDIAFRSFLVGGELKAQFVYIPDMSDRLEMDNNVLKPLMGMAGAESTDLQAIKNRVLPVGSIKEIADAYECARQADQRLSFAAA